MHIEEKDDLHKFAPKFNVEIYVLWKECECLQINLWMKLFINGFPNFVSPDLPKQGTEILVPVEIRFFSIEYFNHTPACYFLHLDFN